MLEIKKSLAIYCSQLRHTVDGQLRAHFFLACIVVLCAGFQPASVDYIPGSNIFDIIYKVLKVGAVLIGIIMLTINGMSDKFALGITLFAAIIGLSSVINGDGFHEWVTNWPLFCSGIYLMQTARRIGQEKMALKSLLIVTGIICLINLGSIIIYPGGLYIDASTTEGDCYFWGHRNTAWQIILCAIVSSMLLDQYEDVSISKRSWTLVIIGVLQVCLAFSATSALALAVFGLVAFVLRRKDIDRIPIGPAVFGTYLIGFISIVILRVQELLNPILQLFGRNASFTGRTEIWESSISLILTPHVVFGYGAGKNLIPGLYEWQPHFVHAHNELLNILLLGGLAGLVCYVTALSCAFQHIEQTTNRKGKLIALAALIALLVIGLVERLTSAGYFLILASTCYLLPDE